MLERVVVTLDCVQEVTDYMKWGVGGPGSGFMANVHYLTAELTVERPDEGYIRTELLCPNCGKTVTVTVWSRKKIFGRRIFCFLGIAFSLPFTIILVGVFPIAILAYHGLLQANSRYGLFGGIDTGLLSQKNEIPMRGHRVMPVKVMKL